MVSSAPRLVTVSCRGVFLEKQFGNVSVTMVVSFWQRGPDLKQGTGIMWELTRVHTKGVMQPHAS